MPISKPTLPPREGYVEVDVDGDRQYQNAKTGELLADEGTIEQHDAQTDIDLMANAYREGVNEA